MNGQAVGGHRALPTVVLLVGGAAVVSAVWVGGSAGWAVGAGIVYVVAAYVWAGMTGDVAALLRSGGDERQRSLDRDALSIAGAAVVAAAVGGVAYAIAPARLAQRR